MALLLQPAIANISAAASRVSFPALNNATTVLNDMLTHLLSCLYKPARYMQLKRSLFIYSYYRLQTL